MSTTNTKIRIPQQGKSQRSNILNTISAEIKLNFPQIITFCILWIRLISRHIKCVGSRHAFALHLPSTLYGNKKKTHKQHLNKYSTREYFRFIADKRIKTYLNVNWKKKSKPQDVVGLDIYFRLSLLGLFCFSCVAVSADIIRLF